jgi:ketosteroid isomerase-like protein
MEGSDDWLPSSGETELHRTGVAAAPLAAAARREDNRGMPPSNLELVGNCLEAAARGDLAAVGEMLHPDVRWHGAGDDEGGCHGREEALAFMRAALDDGAQVRAEWLVEAGELVVAVMRPARPGVDPEEAGYETGTHGTVVRSAGGLIAEITVYPSADDALAAATVPASPV